MTISYVIPTLGRPSLLRTLQSLMPQVGVRDEVIVVADPHGNTGMARGAFDEVADERWQFHVLDEPGDDHGYKARTLGDSLATCDALHHMDDDDVYTDDAVAAMRPHARSEVPVFFRMRYGPYPNGGSGYTLWHDKQVRYGNLGSPCGLIPNRPRQFGEWKEHAGVGSAGGDHTYFVGCVREMGTPAWVDFVVCQIKP